MTKPRSAKPSSGAPNLQPQTLPIDVPPPAQALPRLLRVSEVEALIGLSSATVYRLIQAGRFPPQIKLTEKSVAWMESDVLAWIAARHAESRGGVR